MPPVPKHADQLAHAGGLAPTVNGSSVEIVVPLSVMLELDGHAPVPPPFVSTFAVSRVPADSTVVDVKHGTAPLTPPVTVTGKA